MTNELRKSAKDIAAAGRFGDDVLVHMSASEVEGLASLMPNGKLPINPKTGLPEAFFFLPFLAGLGAAGATGAAATGALGAGLATGAAAAGAGLGAAGLGAAGGALGAAGAAGTLGAAGAGLGAAGLGAASTLGATGAAAGGLGAAGAAGGIGAAGGLGSLGAGAGAAGAMGSAAMPALTAGGGTALSALPVAGASGLTGGTLAGAPLAGIGSAAAPAASGITATGTATGTGAGMAAAANPLTASGTAAAGTGALANAAPAIATGETGKGLAGLMGGMDMNKLLTYGAMASMMMPQGKGKGEDKGKKLDSQNYDRGEAVFPEDGGESGGVTDEWDYFPKSRYYKDGGLVASPDHESFKMEDGKVVVSRKGLSESERYGIATLIGHEKAKKEIAAAEEEGRKRHFSRVGEEHFGQKMKAEYPQKYAGGGLASLGAGEGAEMDDAQLVEATKMALMGQAPNADAIIQMFVQEFGKEALQDLVQRVHEEGAAQQAAAPPTPPMGDGMSDSVPAMISGQNGQSQPAQLSEGEFVVPADAVSGLGNGSTDAGATQLQSMVERTRQMRNGGVVQPPAIDPRAVMPA